MDAVEDRTARQPKFCQACGGEIAQKDAYCGGCGTAVGGTERATATAPVSEPTSAANVGSGGAPPDAAKLRRDAFVAALVLGGAWPLVNRLSSRPLRTWAPMPFTLLWPLAALAAVQWWARFLLGGRAGLSHGAAGMLAGTVALLAVLSMMASLPMATKASRLLADGSETRQRRQSRWAVAIFAAILLYGVAAIASDSQVDAAVNEAQRARGRKAALERRDAVLQNLSNDVFDLTLLGKPSDAAKKLRADVARARADGALLGFYTEGDALTRRERETLDAVLKQADYLGGVVSDEVSRATRRGMPPRPSFWEDVVAEFDARHNAATGAVGAR